jgi:ATP-dependent exoDNAse (exonuclease V) beta subunit
MLAAVDFDGALEAIRSLGMARGRVIGASREEVESAIATCAAALGHPLMRRAAIAVRRSAARREVPVLLRLPKGILAEGIVDLAFREEGANGPAWAVVDFKTDREIGMHQADYERQVGLYAQAISRATGEPSNPWLLVV